MKKKWMFPDEKNMDGDILLRLLRSRGMEEEEVIADFLADRPKLTYDPFLLKDGEESARCILEAVAAQKKICIYGDYDADGICSVTLMLEILEKLGAKVSYYIPSRFEEGYGLNMEAIESIAGEGTGLIVTVDCGSVSAKEVEYAKDLGLTVIVTDHHKLNDDPARCLLVNPRQDSCSYPDKELCGCGVAFKLAQILSRLSGEYAGDMGKTLQKSDLSAVLDLVAIATVGDVVSLLGENRSLVKYGLKTINSGKRKGLVELIRRIELPEGEIRSEHLAYGIVPHLNAGGRINTAKTGVTLLRGTEEGEIREAAKILTENNRERRKLQEEAFEEAARIVESRLEEEPVLVVDSPGTHEGIAGIVAGKIKEKYWKPTLLLTGAGDGHWKGTGRSIEGIDLYAMLSTGKDLFDKFGGHKGACGFLMKKENLSALRDRLRDYAEGILAEDPEAFLPRINIDQILSAEDLSLETVRRFAALEPFGQNNPKPLFCLQDLVPGNIGYMGDKGQHVRFTAGDLSCVLFGRAGEYGELLEGGEPLEFLGYAGINRWNGREKIQFVVADMRCYNVENGR